MANLFDALFFLHNVQTDPIWIDALCTNQVDVEEQSNQVEIIIRSIYVFARRARIWLGRSDADTDFVMDYIANIENRPSSGVRRLVKLASVILYY